MGRVFIESFTPHEHRISVNVEGLGARKFVLPKNFYSEDEQLKGKYRIIEVTEAEAEALQANAMFASLLAHKKFRILTKTIPMKFQDTKADNSKLEKELEEVKGKLKKDYITREKYTVLKKENEKLLKTEAELRNEIASLNKVIVALKKVE